jgi:hypothetical protein
MLIISIFLRQCVALRYFWRFNLLALLVCVFLIAAFFLLINWLFIRMRFFNNHLSIVCRFLHIYYCLFVLIFLLLLVLLLMLFDLFLLLLYFLREIIIHQNYIDFPVVFQILVKALINIIK